MAKDTMTPILDWQPEPTLLEKIIALAERKGKTPEAIVSEAVVWYLENQSAESTNSADDPLIGLFSSASNPVTNSAEHVDELLY